jgi:hypothetical protein
MSLDYAGRLRTSTDAHHDLQGERACYATRQRFTTWQGWDGGRLPFSDEV